MSVYLDASVVVPFFLPDAFTARALSYLNSAADQIVVSDFAAAEFASVAGIRLRNKHLTAAAARTAFSNFDSWLGRYAQPAATTGSDIGVAISFLRRLDLTLRAPDAVNLAIAYRLGAGLATFDSRMADAARKLGIDTIEI